jgi:hypothetical protein
VVQGSVVPEAIVVIAGGFVQDTDRIELSAKFACVGPFITKPSALAKVLLPKTSVVELVFVMSW